MLKLLVVIAVAGVLSILIGCGGGGEAETSPFDSPSALQSPHGSVVATASAGSPDGTLYATQLEPYGSGIIGIFNTATRALVREIHTLPAGKVNPLKALCWSPDSQHIAVLYHATITGHGSGVNTYDVASGTHVRYLGEWGGHYMVWSLDADAREIWCSHDGRTIEARFPVSGTGSGSSSLGWAK